MEIELDIRNLAVTTATPSQVARVAENMFGATLVNSQFGQATAFEASIEYMGITNIRYPGGGVCETGSVYQKWDGTFGISSFNGDQVTWLSGCQEQWNYAFDLRFPGLINPSVLTSASGIVTFQQSLAMAVEHGCSFEIILPTVRYADISQELTTEQAIGLLSRCSNDVAHFLTDLFQNQVYGELPSVIILDIGCENLVWTTSFPGETLAPGVRFDPAAVAWGIGQYMNVAEAQLAAAAEFRGTHPDAAFQMAIQVPSMGNQPGSLDPFDVFLNSLRTMSTSELAQIDIIRFHALEESFSYSAVRENWYAKDLMAFVNLINDARFAMGNSEPVVLASDAHSATSEDTGAGTSGEIRSLKAAAAVVAQFSSLVELGVTFASAWGVAIDYRLDVQASYFDPSDKQTHFTPVGEVIRQMAEVLPGTSLIDCPQYIDADRSGAVNMQVFGDDSKNVIFLSANDINDGDNSDSGTAGETVVIKLDGLSSGISYAWAESITCTDGHSGEAVVWNPLSGYDLADSGRVQLDFSANEVTVTLRSDFEMIRIVVANGEGGMGALRLIGDSRIGLGVVDDVLTGGSGADILQGVTGDDVLCGAGGNDSLFGDSSLSGIGKGADCIFGGSGCDHIFGGSGSDTLHGGKGSDSIFGGDGDDVVFYDRVDGLVDGGAGHDILVLVSSCFAANALGGGFVFDSDRQRGFEVVRGSVNSDAVLGDYTENTFFGAKGNDSISGWAGQDSIFGGLGRDVLWGGRDNDVLGGGGGDDTIHGDSGDDTIRGGEGTDNLFGGDGADLFQFGTQKELGDVIFDFCPVGVGQDLIGIDASNFGIDLGVGQAAEGLFVAVERSLSSASDSLFVFRKSDTSLWLDVNGGAPDGLVLVAKFDGLVGAFSAEDIFIF